MEELLNKLIEKGWKPRGEKVELYGTSENTFGERIVIFNGNAGGFKRWGCTYRELVSKESGLWQFVCENGLIPEDKMKHEWVLDLTFGPYGPEVEAQMHSRTYEYWLMSSALKDESELKQFLLDNIKVDG